MQITINIDDKVVEKLRGAVARTRAVLVVLLILGTATLVSADPIEVPHEFEGGEIISSEQVNENFQALADAINERDRVPTGAIIAWPLETPPDGYLECDGEAVSRSEYAELFDVLRTTYGEGDGTTTFNLPDYRGYFLRGWNHGSGVDPDASARTDRGDDTSGDFVGTQQQNEIQQHQHFVTDVNNGGRGASGEFLIWDQYDNGSDATTGLAGGNETRPVNVSVMYCIRY